MADDRFNGGQSMQAQKKARRRTQQALGIRCRATKGLNSLNHIAIITRAQKLIGLVTDCLVDEVHTSIGETELRAGGMLGAETPGVIPVIFPPTLWIQVAAINGFLLVSCARRH